MAHPLPALHGGAVVCVDANIFIYGLLGESGQCADLIERCRKEEVAGVTTTEVVAEVCHRLMVKEAMDLGLIRRPAASALKSKHDAIRGLRKYWELTARIFQWNLVASARDTVQEVVREWFEQQLVETVLGVQSLKGSQEW